MKLVFYVDCSLIRIFVRGQIVCGKSIWIIKIVLLDYIPFGSKSEIENQDIESFIIFFEWICATWKLWETMKL